MKQDDPFSGFLYRLNLGNIEIAGFAECTGIEIETKIFEYKEGGRNSHTLKFPEHSEVKNIVLKKGLTISYELFDWYMNIADGLFDHPNQRPVSQRDPGYNLASNKQDINSKISVVLVDHAGEPRKEWMLRRAFPVKWIGPDFKASDNNVAFETIELAHEGLEKLVQ